MPIDLMALAEGGPAQLPGRRSSGSGKNIFANKELLAKYEQAASPEKQPQEELPRRKSWTPPAKPASDPSDDMRNPWDPPKPKSPAKGSRSPAKPPPIISARSGDKVDDEMPVSPRLADNPFMRRDSKAGMQTDAVKPLSPSAKSAPRNMPEQAYPVDAEAKVSEEAKAKAEATAKQAADEEAKAAAESKASAKAAAEAEAKAATQIQAIAKGNSSRAKAEAQRVAAKTEPVTTAAAAQPATGDAKAALPSPQKQPEQLKSADEPQTREEETGRPATAPTGDATSPKSGAKEKEKEKKPHRLSGSNLFSFLSPRSRRSSRDEGAA